MSSDTDTKTEISPDLVFELLSSTRRRRVLYYLREHGGVATVNELAESIAAMENEIDVEDLNRQQRKRVYVSLYQTHVPKLVEAGIIEYDDNNGEVRLTDRAVETDTYLTPASEAVYPWQLHYLALAVVSAVALGLSVAGVPVIGDVQEIWIGIAITATFAASALVQYRSFKRRKRELPQELSDGK